METVAVRAPVPLGVQRTTKVKSAPPAAIELPLGCVCTVKSPEPLSATMGVPVRLRVSVPSFWMVKVRSKLLPTATLPKSVWSALDGLVSPSGMDWPLPSTSISGAMG